jgi:hypothetical protein
MGYTDKVPMLGCENAWIAAGALMAALKNQGTIKITNDQIDEALNRTRRQSIGGYCGLTGVCGIAPAIGACFSIILGAACPKDQETATTMRVVGKIVNCTADQTGPCCCKNFVRTALLEAVKLATEYLNVTLPSPVEITVCKHVERHPHGCRKDKCLYYKPSEKSVLWEGERNMFSAYDQFHSSIYRQEGVLGRQTKHLIALAASLAAGCEP